MCLTTIDPKFILKTKISKRKFSGEWLVLSAE